MVHFNCGTSWEFRKNWHQLKRGFSWWVPLQGRTPLDLQHTNKCFDHRNPDLLQCQRLAYSSYSKWRRRHLNIEKRKTKFIYFLQFLTRLLSAKFNYLLLLIYNNKSTWVEKPKQRRVKGKPNRWKQRWTVGQSLATWNLKFKSFFWVCLQSGINKVLGGCS